MAKKWLFVFVYVLQGVVWSIDENLNMWAGISAHVCLKTWGKEPEVEGK